MRMVMVTAIVLSVALGGCSTNMSPGPDDGKTNWNRRVEAVSVMPAESGDSEQSVTAFFSLEAANVDEPIDLSTEMQFLVNGEVVETQRFDIAAHPAGASAFGCNCPPPLLCWVVDGFPRGCGEAPLVCDPRVFSLDPDDDLTLQLRASGAGLEELARADDARRIDFQGQAFLAVAPTAADGKSGLRKLEPVR